MSKPLSLCVVGHTNVGKTSLMRTLTRNVNFGQVSPNASTTRHVEGAQLMAHGQAMLSLYDTPGLEDAGGLLDYLDRIAPPQERLDGPTKLTRFFDSLEARQRFEQEAKVLRQLLQSDAGLYVIDCREPRLEKYRDELEILSDTGKPLLPVLNFTQAAQADEAAWRELLARNGLHAVVCFDSIAPPQDGERRLFESLMLLVRDSQDRLQQLIQDREQQAQQRYRAGQQLIADLLIDAAALRLSVDPSQAAPELIQQPLSEREQRCVQALLALYEFRPEDASLWPLPLVKGRWEHDVFNPDSLKEISKHLGGGAAAGAAAGVGIDLITGGLSLGAGALLGAIAGGGLQTARQYGKRLRQRLSGQQELTVEDDVLRALAWRQKELLNALNRRGHAAQTPHTAEPPLSEVWLNTQLPEPLARCRAHPEWSRLNGSEPQLHGERQRTAQAIAALLNPDQ